MKLAPVQPLVVWLVLAPRAPWSITKSMESGHHRIQVDMWDDVFPDFVISTDCGEEVFHWQVLNPALIVLEVLKFPAVQCNTSEVCRHQVLSRSAAQNIIHHPEFFLHLAAALIGKWLPKVATKFSSNPLSRESSRYVGTLFCPYLLGIQQIKKTPWNQKTLNDAKENCLATTANHGTLISINLCIYSTPLAKNVSQTEKNPFNMSFGLLLLMKGLCLPCQPLTTFQPPGATHFGVPSKKSTLDLIKESLGSVDFRLLFNFSSGFWIKHEQTLITTGLQKKTKSCAWIPTWISDEICFRFKNFGESPLPLLHDAVPAAAASCPRIPIRCRQMHRMLECTSLQLNLQKSMEHSNTVLKNYVHLYFTELYKYLEMYKYKG